MCKLQKLQKERLSTLHEPSCLILFEGVFSNSSKKGIMQKNSNSDILN